eukprot:Skav232749  [mRNA]  locus=scaffold757:7718:12580:+ [translate_table: standard]
MVLTLLSRTAGRAALQAARAPSALGNTAVRSICTTQPKLGGYDYNLGWPGSRIKNPDPEGYNDVAPPMGFGWWALIVTSVSCFFWGNTYDHSRGIKVAIGLFGPNMPI